MKSHNPPQQVEALKTRKISKPVVAWVSGTCATLFKSEVQFGHAGARSGGALESAQVRSPCCPTGASVACNGVLWWLLACLDTIRLCSACYACTALIKWRQHSSLCPCCFSDPREQPQTILKLAATCTGPGRLRPPPCILDALQGKNAALAAAGAIVPRSFEDLEPTIARAFQQLVADGHITSRPEPTPPTVPMDLAAAQKAGLVRRCVDAPAAWSAATPSCSVPAARGNTGRRGGSTQQRPWS